MHWASLSVTASWGVYNYLQTIQGKAGDYSPNININWFEERKIRIFENRIMRRIFGHKRDANGERKRLHIEEIYNL